MNLSARLRHLTAISLVVLFSLSGTALAASPYAGLLRSIDFNAVGSAQVLDYEIVMPEEGNVPIRFIPGSTISFDEDGEFTVTSLVPLSEECVQNDTPVDSSLPVYPYEQRYTARAGAVAVYDQQGQLVRVVGDCEYSSTLDQYLVDGQLPSGVYVGTYFTFTQRVE
jgi:hypothetical protein